MDLTSHTFRSGRLTLNRVHVACARPVARVVLVHGYGDHSGRYRDLYRHLAACDIESHGVDLRGHGRSEGRRGAITTWDDHLDDLRAFLALAELRSSLPTFLLGHSHGGLVVAVAAMRGMLGGVRGCILSSPYLRSCMTIPRWKVALAHAADRVVPWLRVRSGLRDDWMTSDPAMVADSAADPLLNRGATPRWFLRTAAVQSTILADAPRLTTPLLCLVGGDDRIADAACTRSFFDACGSTDRTLRTYPTLRHELLRETGRDGVFSDVVGFVRARSGPRQTSPGGH